MRGSADKLVRDVRVVVHDAEELIRATAGDIEEKTRAARARLAGALVVAKDSLSKAEQAANGRLPSSAALVLRFRDHPYQIVGVAFVTGLLLGALMARRRWRTVESRIRFT